MIMANFKLKRKYNNFVFYNEHKVKLSINDDQKRQNRLAKLFPFYYKEIKEEIKETTKIKNKENNDKDRKKQNK